MLRRTVLGLVAVAAMDVGTAAGPALAQQSEMDAVRATVDAAYAALSTRDIAAMEAVWVHGPDVMLVNPRDRTVSVGWDDVRKNWVRTFDFWAEFEVVRTNGPIRINGDTAVATGGAEASGTTKTGAVLALSTMGVDVLEKRGGKWLLVSHSAWMIPK